MPTAANTFNNSIDLLGWPYTVIGGGRRKNFAKYGSWRSEVEVQIRGKGWQWKKDGSNDYDELLMECVGLEDFPSLGATLIRWNPKTDDTKPAHKALKELMLDCFNKVRESRGKRRIAGAREELLAEAGQDEEDEGAATEGRVPRKRARFEDVRPVVIYILDPQDDRHHPAAGKWNWSAQGVKRLGVLYESSLNQLHCKVSSYRPDGRKVREIIGALKNARDEDGDDLKVPADATHIRSDDELFGFLRLTGAVPAKLLIVLYRDPAVRANSAPPARGNPSRYYFNLGRFDGPEYYVDEVEDSGEEVPKRAGGKRGVPHIDHKFEESLEDCRRRIRRQQRQLGTLEVKHKAAFPDTVHDSDPGGELRVLCYGEEDGLSGMQVVWFKEVIVDYVADLAVRRTANMAAGRGLTDDQIKIAVVDQV